MSQRRVVIVDADSIVYGSCVTLSPSDPVQYALANVRNSLKKLVTDTECDEVVVVVSGKGNFRYDIYPEYKANRKDMTPPPYIPECRQYIIDRWDGIQIDGIEADDTCCMLMYAMDKDPDALHIIAHIDKDLDMIEGRHYNYRKQEWYEIDEDTAYRNFHLQMITGDTADNIPGLYKLTGKKAMKKYREPLDDMVRAEDMWKHVLSVYKECSAPEAWPDVRKTLGITSKLLWLKRAEKEELLWQVDE